MATTTTSNRKKPSASAKAAKVTKKTIKKPVKTASASAKKTVQTKKSTVKAAPAKARASARTPQTPFERLRSLHLSTGVLYLIFAGLVVGFTTTVAKAVNLGISARDNFASNGNVVLGTSHEVFYNIEPKYILAGSLVVSGLASLLFATKLRGKYEQSLVNRISRFRWIALALSASLLFAFISTLAGVSDLATLKLSAVLILVSALMGWVSEQQNVKSAKPSFLAFGVGTIAGVLAWIAVVGTLIGTSVYGEERFGWHVYAVAGATLLGFALLGLRHYRSLRTSGRQQDYAVVEEAYLRIDLLTKFAVVLIVLLALK